MNYRLSVTGVQLDQRTNSAIAGQCKKLPRPQTLLRTSAKNSFYKGGKILLWVSTKCV